METQLFVLGFLIKCGKMHGYLLKQVIDSRVSDFTGIKMSNLYYHLKKLIEKKCIIGTLEQQENKPDRWIYEITDEGKVYFNKLLYKSLEKEEEMIFSLDHVIFFYDSVDSKKFAAVIEKKIDSYEKKLQYLKTHKNEIWSLIPEQMKSKASLIFDHHEKHIIAELKWLKKVLKEI